MKVQLLQMIQIFNGCKITVGCRLCAYPSTHVENLKITSVARRAHLQAIVQTLSVMLDSMVHAGDTRAVGTSTRADACACAGVPQPRLCEFTSL